MYTFISLQEKGYTILFDGAEPKDVKREFNRDNLELRDIKIEGLNKYQLFLLRNQIDKILLGI